MTALLIIAGIVLLLALLLNCPVRAELSYLDGVPDFSVWYLCFKVYPLKEKKPAKKRKRKVKNRKNTSAENLSDNQSESADNKNIPDKQADEEKPLVSDRLKDKLAQVREESSEADEELLSGEKKPDKLAELKETIEKVKLVWNAAKGGVKHLFRHIKIYDISLDIVTADEDAYEAAMKYGRMNNYVYGGISLLRTFFTISLKKINIQCKFNSTQSRCNLSCSVRITPATAIFSALAVLIKYIILIIPDKIQQRSSQPNK